MSHAHKHDHSHPHKTPPDVSDAIKRLEVKDQVLVQTYIAKLKTSLKDLEDEVKVLKDGDGHAHFHGHEKCTHDHSHDDGAHEHEHNTTGHDHGHDRNATGHDHGHDHSNCTEDHDHSHGHGHGHGHSHAKEEATKHEIPAWKKKAMEAGNDPMAAPFGGTWTAESSVDATASSPVESTEAPFPPLYAEGEDYDKMQSAKMEASDLKATGDYEGALAKYTEAVLAAPPSALLYANRADCLLRLKRSKAAIQDCNEALKLNPDSAKALRILGKAQLHEGSFKAARANLSASQTIDFDDSVVEDLKVASEKVKEMEAAETKKRVEEEERLRKRAEEIKKAREEAAAEKAKASTGGTPSGMPGGVPPGMEGMMAGLMNDPEMKEGLSNPKVQAAFKELMSQPGGPMGLLSNPAKLQELMTDPEVGPFMQKLMSKVTGGMPGMAGMGGGASPFGGGAAPGAGPMDEDDIPDMPEM